MKYTKLDKHSLVKGTILVPNGKTKQSCNMILKDLQEVKFKSKGCYGICKR